jgi:two-component system CheB/CheR fusion protein
MSDWLPRTLGETIQVVTVPAEDLNMTLADPGQVKNAILNLAINARDAMPNGGTLTIKTANAELDPLRRAFGDRYRLWHPAGTR